MHVHVMTTPRSSSDARPGRPRATPGAAAGTMRDLPAVRASRILWPPTTFVTPKAATALRRAPVPIVDGRTFVSLISSLIPGGGGIARERAMWAAHGKPVPISTGGPGARRFRRALGVGEQRVAPLPRGRARGALATTWIRER